MAAVESIPVDKAAVISKLLSKKERHTYQFKTRFYIDVVGRKSCNYDVHLFDECPKVDLPFCWHFPTCSSLLFF